MANHSVTGTLTYSGTTTGTDQDILTLTGFNSVRGGLLGLVRVTNLDDANYLFVRTDATTATLATGDGVVVIPPGQTVSVPPEGAGHGNGTVTVRLISDAACPYMVVGVRS